MDITIWGLLSLEVERFLRDPVKGKARDSEQVGSALSSYLVHSDNSHFSSYFFMIL